MSGNQPSNRPSFSVPLPTLIAAIPAMAGLTVALQFAVEAAVFPDRLKVDGETKTARLEALTQALLREAKSAITEGVPESDEASGLTAVIAIINEIAGGLRTEIQGS
jgi:hypothetical protein